MQFPISETAINNWRTIFKNKTTTYGRSMDVEIDTERFINEVKIRPILWDTSLDTYRDRPKTKEAWASIAATLAPEIETDKDREELGRELQMKWRNLRDALLRSERGLRGSRSKKTYRYAEQMSFLKSVKKTAMPRLLRSDNSIKMDELSVDDDQMKRDDVQIKNEDTSNCSSDLVLPSAHYEENFRGFPSAANNVTTTMDQLDDDMCFFQSLLPTVRTLDNRQKLNFRISVMRLLQQEFQT